jgi:hypothetical protein
MKGHGAERVGGHRLAIDDGKYPSSEKALPRKRIAVLEREEKRFKEAKKMKKLLTTAELVRNCLWHGTLRYYSC